MSTDFTSFPLSEPAKKRGRTTANACSIVLVAIISCGAWAVLTSLLNANSAGMDSRGKLLILSLMALTFMLWGSWVGAIVLAAIRRRKWFAAISGTVSFAANTLHIGTLTIERSSIISGEKTWRHLLIRYRADDKPCQVALPLNWLPEGAADHIVWRIEEKD
jgi:hypothetical protein